ncbi:MAG: hypothetical protein RLZZ507_2749 [Cyanobacteriota bacterium]|jgi:hypothetical protein
MRFWWFYVIWEDNQGAIPTVSYAHALLERLIKLHPDRQDDQTVLGDARKR